jgi:hypothetical protein
VAGYPLPPDLNLGAEFVHDAITALGPDVALATVNLDIFRAHFIEPDQKGILVPLETAFKSKNADKMKTGDEVETDDEMETDDESVDEMETGEEMETVDEMEIGDEVESGN